MSGPPLISITKIGSQSHMEVDAIVEATVESSHQIIAIRPHPDDAIISYYQAREIWRDRFDAKDAEVKYWLGGDGQESNQNIWRLSRPTGTLIITGYQGNTKGFVTINQYNTTQWTDIWLLYSQVLNFTPDWRLLSFSEVVDKYSLYGLSTDEIKALLRQEIIFQESIKLCSADGTRWERYIGKIWRAEEKGLFSHEYRNADIAVENLYYAENDILSICQKKFGELQAKHSTRIETFSSKNKQTVDFNFSEDESFTDYFIRISAYRRKGGVGWKTPITQEHECRVKSGEARTDWNDEIQCLLIDAKNAYEHLHIKHSTIAYQLKLKPPNEDMVKRYISKKTHKYQLYKYESRENN